MNVGKLNQLIAKVQTAFALGISNLWRVFVYRVALKTGIHPVCRQKAVLPTGPFYTPATTGCTSPCADTIDRWTNQALYFGWLQVPIGDAPPDWHFNPLTQTRISEPKQPWWKISDFNTSTGDIKGVWEASRFSWVLAETQQAVAGDPKSLVNLNTWLADWCHNNPAYLGPNWKCGQEASIRVMHLSMASLILGQHLAPVPALMALIRIHLNRIAPTLSYAIAQDNNHGTSEAAALFIGGTWLLRIEGGRDTGRWAKTGRHWLENRVSRLIASDGSFSQHSINYHRVLVDTLCMVEIWRRAMDLPAFSNRFQSRCIAAAEWLVAMIDSKSGDAPNLGANDGANLFPLMDAKYRDFRPTAKLAYALFKDAAILPEKNGNSQFAWLKVTPPSNRLNAENCSCVFPKGGYVVLHGETSWALVRYANFRFRPSHADCLNFDLWQQGQNILRDGGTFSYNTEERWLNYFSGTASHNTIQFDDRDQMPRLGRFLFGAWLKMDECTNLHQTNNSISWTGAYTDWQKAWHRRTVSVTNDTWRIKDEISGFKEKAILRWRLKPEHWLLENNSCSSNLAQINVHSSASPRRIELVTGWGSLFYQQKTEIPVLEVEVGPGQWTLETEINLKT